MRVLWLCNTVPSEICDVFGFKKHHVEGWINGMINELKHYNDVDIALCIPIRNSDRMMDGKAGSLYYYSFLSTGLEEYSDGTVQRFREIISDFNPDLIQVWGAEYANSLAMIKAGETMGLSGRVLLHIQGLASACVTYFDTGIPPEWLRHESENGSTIEKEKMVLARRGSYEIKTLSKVRFVLGRTEWDRAYVCSVSDAEYIYCGEILRDEFYSSDFSWNIDECIPHSIFVTQGYYSIKGIHLILPAIAQLKKKYSDISVYISGNSVLKPDYEGEKDPYSEYLIYLMEKYEVRDNIHFIGPLEPIKMIERYLKSNIVAVPSTIENSSNTIGEAQLLGVPVVATYTGGTPSLIEHGKTGLMYQMDMPYMFASCVEKIFSDEDYAMYLSENEVDIAKKRYDPKRVGKQLFRVYNEVIKN